MTNNTKKKKLSDLKEQYKSEKYFFFPLDQNINHLPLEEGIKKYLGTGVKGFLGTGDVFFVCQKPSRGKFPSSKDELFYKTLAKYGFQNSHITDITKIRGKSISKISKKDRESGWKLMRDEIKILNPKLIVAVGNNSYENLIDMRKNKPYLRDIGIVKIIHYAYRYDNKANIKHRLEADMKNVKNIMNK